MANRSSFPTTIDTFIEHHSILASDITNINRYRTLLLKSTPRTEAEETELANLVNLLDDKIIDCEDVNKIQDCVTNMENFIKDEVEGYIETKQIEFDASVNQLSYQGQWDSVTQYYAKNLVLYSGNVYMAKIDNINHAPTTGDNYDGYWLLLSKKGEKGDTGITLQYRGDYNPATTYILGDAVSYTNGNIYYCKATTVGHVPTDTNYWVPSQKVYSGVLTPSDPVEGDLWIDANYMKMKYYTGAVWLEVRGYSLNANIDYYVSLSGNDENDGLTTGTAFLTITKAFNSLPKNLNGYTANINVISVTPASFSEILNINGFYGNGIINLIGNIDHPDYCATNSIIITGNSINYIKISGVSFVTPTSLGAARCYSSNNIWFDYCRFSGSSNTYDGVWNDSSFVKVTNSVFLACNYCVHSTAYVSTSTPKSFSSVSIGTCTGSDNNYVAFADGGLVILNNYNLPSYNTALYKTAQGGIVSGASGGFVEKLNANKTIYVATTGNDTTGDGSSGTPYLTITKALSVIPKDLGGYSAIINIGIGTYTENLDVRYYHSGTLSIGITGNNVTLNGHITVFSSKTVYLYIDTINNSSDHAITSNYGSIVRIMKICTITGNSSYYGLNINQHASLTAEVTVQINNSSRAISAVTHGKVFVTELIGSGNTTGLYSTSGAKISYGSSTLGATTATSTTAGGRILSGAQSSIPNY